MMRGLSSLLGKINKLFFFDFSLDKLLDWWYNRNAGRWVRRRHAQKKRPMGLFIPQVIGPILNPGSRLIMSGFAGVIGHLIHHFFEHCFIPLSFCTFIIAQGAEFVNPFFYFFIEIISSS
jgi:hypothetical protein